MNNTSILSVEKLGMTFGGIHALEDISFDVKEKVSPPSLDPMVQVKQRFLIV